MSSQGSETVLSPVPAGPVARTGSSARRVDTPIQASRMTATGAFPPAFPGPGKGGKRPPWRGFGARGRGVPGRASRARSR